MDITTATAPFALPRTCKNAPQLSCSRQLLTINSKACVS
uniref:Uncharacterized protein n=1 Tax=Arundo donax TaxID=35708 RepID=A0A0A9FPM5_ARUDO